MADPDLDVYKDWTPAAQQAALERLQKSRNDDWRPFYCPLTNCDGKPHDVWEWNHARGSQRPPTDDAWLVWLMKSGRGAGKTRAGSEFTHRVAERVSRIALVAATGADVRDTLLEGESGLLTIARPGWRPTYEPSKRRLTWPNGCVGTTFSAEEPDRLRGPEHAFAWCDEPAHWPLVQEAWDNLMFGLRIGKQPRIVVTTTPKPRAWMKELIAAPTTRISSASTYDNIDNLAPNFAEIVIKKYEGTRQGRQEIYGELLADVEGALWNFDMIEPHRVLIGPDMARVVVAVDPAGTANKHSDETGIVVIGKGVDGRFYPLADRSGKHSPSGWAKAVDAAWDEYEADAVVCEDNYGGDLVVQNLRASGINKRIIRINSRRGKSLRAEPIVGLYEQGLVAHVGILETLEEQMTTWQPYEDRDSPDRVDALVHGMTELAGKARTGDIATPASLRRHVRPVRPLAAHVRGFQP